MVRSELLLSNDLLELLTNHGIARSVGGPRTPSRIAMQGELDSALNGLTADERHILWLRFWEHYSFRQIQRELNHKSVDTTFRLYKKALSKLRESLDDDTSERNLK